MYNHHYRFTDNFILSIPTENVKDILKEFIYFTNLENVFEDKANELTVFVLPKDNISYQTLDKIETDLILLAAALKGTDITYTLYAEANIPYMASRLWCYFLSDGYVYSEKGEVNYVEQRNAFLAKL